MSGTITRIKKAAGMGQRTKSRFVTALGGTPSTPLVAGLTFAPREVLASVAPGCRRTADCLLAAADALALDFVFVRASEGWAQDVVAAPRHAAALWVVDGPLWPALGSLGTISDAIAMTARDPASLRPRLDRETARGAEMIRLGMSLGIDGVVIAEDLAGRDGLLFTPAYFRTELVPRLTALVNLAGNLPVLLHSDGDIGAILPLLRRAGIAAVHTGGGVDRDRFEELFWEARRAGLAMVGGIPVPSLSRGTHAAVRAGTHAALLAQAGGLLIADDGGITTPQEMGAFAAAVGAARAGARQRAAER